MQRIMRRRQESALELLQFANDLLAFKGSRFLRSLTERFEYLALMQANAEGQLHTSLRMVGPERALTADKVFAGPPCFLPACACCVDESSRVQIWISVVLGGASHSVCLSIHTLADFESGAMKFLGQQPVAVLVHVLVCLGIGLRLKADRHDGIPISSEKLWHLLVYSAVGAPGPSLHLEPAASHHLAFYVKRFLTWSLKDCLRECSSRLECRSLCYTIWSSAR